MGQSYAFTIRDIEPYRDPAWHLARPEVRRAFWREVVRIGLEVKDRELARGIGVDGRKLARLSRYTILHRKSEMGRADPYAPPLTPAHEASRTRSLLAGRAHPDFAQFFWRTDPVSGLHWGKILGYHRAGSHRLPRRNVIGISDDSLAEVKERAHQWWENHKKGIVAEVEPDKLRLQLAPTPPRPPRPPKVAPPKINVTGRTDLDNFTFGIGGGKDMVAQSMAAGYFTGFRQFPTSGSAVANPAITANPPAPKAMTIPIPRPKPPAPPLKPPRASVPKPAPRPKPPKPTEVKPVAPPPPVPPPPPPPPPKEEVKPTQFGPDQVLECIRQLQAGEFAGTDLVPVYAIRRLVAQRYGPLNASHGILDPIIKGMRADGKIRLIAISDNRGATQDQLDNSIPGLNETLFYVIMR